MLSSIDKLEIVGQLSVLLRQGDKYSWGIFSSWLKGA